MCCLGDETQKSFCLARSVLLPSPQDVPLLGSAQYFLCMEFAVHVKTVLQEQESIQCMLA